MTVPLFILAVGALLAGVVFKEYFFGHHYDGVLGCFRESITLPDQHHPA
jgi:NADH-quinone oxidoreductase subunit L